MNSSDWVRCHHSSTHGVGLTTIGVVVVVLVCVRPRTANTVVNGPTDMVADGVVVAGERNAVALKDSGLP